MKRIIIALFILATLPSWAAEEGENLDGKIFWADSVYYNMIPWGTGREYQLVVADREMVSNYIESYPGEVPFPAFDEGFSKGVLTIPDSVFYQGMKYRVTKLCLEDLDNSSISINCDRVVSLRRGKFHHVDLGARIRYIEDAAFDGCENLTHITMPRKIDQSSSPLAFANISSIEHITVSPRNWDYVDVDGVMFNRCKSVLERFPMSKCSSYEVPMGTQFIQSQAFSCDSDPAPDQSHLTSLVLSENVRGLGNEVFKNNKTLREIRCMTAFPPVKVMSWVYNKVFDGFDNMDNCVLRVPKGCRQNYESNQCWGKFKTIIEDEEPPTATASQHLTDLDDVRKLYKTPSPLVISDSILYMVHWPNDIAYPVNHEWFGLYTNPFGKEYSEFICKGDAHLVDSIYFEGVSFTVSHVENMQKVPCSTLKISDTVKMIYHGAFQNCNNLREIDLGNGVELICESAFRACPKLSKITIPKQVTECYKAFYGVYPMEEITVDPSNTVYSSHEGALFSKDMKTLYKYPLARCESYEIPELTEYIADYAFACEDTGFPSGPASKLKSLKIGKNVKGIGAAVFKNNAVLEEIICMSEEPYPYESVLERSPSIVLSRFSNIYHCVLRVPKGCKEVYANDELWGNFQHIEEFESPDSIETLTGIRQSNDYIYDLSGRKIRSTLPDSYTPTLLRKGIYIVNGKKIVVK